MKKLIFGFVLFAVCGISQMYLDAPVDGGIMWWVQLISSAMGLILMAWGGFSLITIQKTH